MLGIASVGVIGILGLVIGTTFRLLQRAEIELVLANI